MHSLHQRLWFLNRFGSCLDSLSSSFHIRFEAPVRSWVTRWPQIDLLFCRIPLRPSSARTFFGSMNENLATRLALVRTRGGAVCVSVNPFSTRLQRDTLAKTPGAQNDAARLLHPPWALALTPDRALATQQGSAQSGDCYTGDCCKCHRCLHCGCEFSSI